MTLALLLAAAAADPGRVWVADLDLRGDEAPIWFAEERAVVTDAVGQALRDLGWDVVDDGEVRATWAALRAGDGGCPVSSPVGVGTEARLGARRVGVGVSCEDGGCTLRVVPGGGDLRTLELPLGGTPAGWAARIRAAGLTPVEPADEVGRGILGGIVPADPPGPPVRVRDLRLTGTWSEPPTRRVEAAAGLLACAALPPSREDSFDRLQLAADARGHVTRCEAAAADHLDEPADTCACDVLARVELGPGAPDRRASFLLSLPDLWPPPEPLRRAELEDVAADDAGVLVGRRDEGALAACLAPYTSPFPARTFPVRLEVGAEGAVTRVDVRSLRDVDRPLVRCLRAALGGQRFDCPAAGSARVTADLVLEVGERW